MTDSESPLRRMMDDTGKATYRPLASLSAARADAHGIAVLEGDDGGQVYIVCSAQQIQCSDTVLQQLLIDLDEIEWPGNDPNMRRIYFESRPVGEGVPGGMGGGQVVDGFWIHPSLAKHGLSDAIKEVLSGKKQRIK